MSRYPAISVRGAVVAITGGARGIGRATAEEFVAAGAKVAIGDLDLDLAKRTAEEIGHGTTAHRLDVTDRLSYADFLDEVRAAHGELDVLVNNAGVMPAGAFLDEEERTSRMTMDVNVFGVINGMQLALPAMIERGRGHIVNVASLAGKFPIKGLAVYNASKFAVVGLTAATRLEYADSGVSISAVLPSAVETELSSGIDFAPLPNTQPSEIAAAVVASVKSRRAESAVPAYVGTVQKSMAFVPERVELRVRKLFKDDRALHPDERRAAYDDRLRAQK